MFNDIICILLLAGFGTLSKQETGREVKVVTLVNLMFCSVDVLLNLHIHVFNELICICCFSSICNHT